MWYISYLLFAEPNSEDGLYDSESCNVLFQADSALIAYEKSLIWARQKEKGTTYRFVGIEHITSVDDDPIHDGSELAGSFSQIENVWDRKEEICPAREEIPIIRLEGIDGDTPIGDLLSDDAIKLLEKMYK